MNLRLLLALSMALNMGLTTLLILQTASRPSPESRNSSQPANLPQTTSSPSTQTDENTPHPTLDYRRLFGALRATGLPRDEIDQILRGAALSDWLDDLRSLQNLSPTEKADTETLRELIEFRRAREAALSETTQQEEFLASHGWMIGAAWDSVPPEKLKAIIMLEEDYQLLFSGIANNSSATRTEKEKNIRLLLDERTEDLRTILTDSELADYESTIETGNNPVSALTQFAVPPPSAPSETGLPESETLPSRESDPAFLELHQLAEQFDLPPERAAEIYELRRVVQIQRETFRSDPNLSETDKNAAIERVTNDARNVTRMLLGPEAFNSYLESDGDWLR